MEFTLTSHGEKGIESVLCALTEVCDTSDEERKFWDVSAQLEYWCDLLGSREIAVQELQMYGYKVEIDCYINWGPVVLISIPSDLLKKLGNLGIELSLGFYATEVLAKENSNCEDEPA